MKEKIMYVPARLENSVAGEYVTGTGQIIDDASGKTQAEIDVEINSSINSLQGQIDNIRQSSSAVDAYTKEQSDSKFATKDKADSISADVDTLTESVNTLSSNAGALDDNVNALSGTVDTLSGNMNTLSGTVSTLSDNVSSLSGTVNQMVSSPNNKPTVSKTWAEMIQLRNSNGFIPGQTYRITDYQTAGKTGYCHIYGYGGHAFDIIVEALTTNTLSEDAKAAKRAGDTYFVNNQLEAWKLKYILDPANDARISAYLRPAINDQTRGWIYYMEDENFNSANYDFKNILTAGVKVADYIHKDYVGGENDAIKGDIYLKYIFKDLEEVSDASSWIDILGGLYTVNPSDTKLFYLFSYLKEDGTVIDASVNGVRNTASTNYFSYPQSNRMSEACHGSKNTDGNNRIEPMINIFVCDWEWHERWGGPGLPGHNTFGQRSWGNTFGSDFRSNNTGEWMNCCVFGHSTVGNVFNYNADGCILGNHSLNNTVSRAKRLIAGNGFQNNTITLLEECAFGNTFSDNEVSGRIKNTVFGDSVWNNTINNMQDCTFGDAFQDNEVQTMRDCTFGNRCLQNTFAKDCRRIHAGNNFFCNLGNGTMQDLTVGNSCTQSVFDNVQQVTIGDSCVSNHFGSPSVNIVIGNRCTGNTFEGGNNGVRIGDNCRANHFGKMCRSIIFGSSETDIKGYYIANMIESYNDHIILNCTATTSTSNRFMGINIATRTHSPYYDNTTAGNYVYKVITNNETEQNFPTYYTNGNAKSLNV